MKILENVQLQDKNTLGLKAYARYYTEVSTLKTLRSALAFAEQKKLTVMPLGGGSNIVLSGDLNLLVLKIDFMGISILEDKDNKTVIESGAGENWHDFVRWCLNHKAYGLENLSLIPGSVGAAPIQNIGAYGVELKDHFHSLTAIDISSGETVQLLPQHCLFSYRSSTFKTADKDRYIITAVRFLLDKQLQEKLDYGVLNERMSARCTNSKLTAQLISNTVCDIRREKLPDPDILGNAGSFFKNPIVTDKVYKQLQQQHSDIVVYRQQGSQNNHWKLAAGWLIENAGLKGIREGTVGTYSKQALVLVNHGGASGADVIRFSQMIQQQVYNRFGVRLELEPRIY